MLLSAVDDESAKKELMELIMKSAHKGIETTISQKLDTRDYKFNLYNIENNIELTYLISVYDLTSGIMKPYYVALCEYKKHLEELQNEVSKNN